LALRSSWANWEELGVDGEAADSAVFYAAEEFDEAFEVHRFLKDVLHDFV